jgi:hypothetical protein
MHAIRLAAVVEKAIQRVHMDVLVTVLDIGAGLVICDATLDCVQDPGIEAEVGKDVDIESLQDLECVYNIGEVEDEHVVASI